MLFTKHCADEYRRHVEYHNEAALVGKDVTMSKFPCLDCSDGFKEYYELKRHMKNSHPKFEFRCRDKTCTEIFFDRENRRRHWVNKHKLAGQMFCEVSDRFIFKYIK